MASSRKTLTLILGGARSGKSAFAETLASKRGSRVLYVATAAAGDEEMAQRIEVHRRSRPASWQTLEEPLEVPAALRAVSPDFDLVLVDCITLWVSNLLLQIEGQVVPDEAERLVLRRVDELIAACRDGTASYVLIANEVGLGLVPPYPLGRIYRDALGRANQSLAASADEVFFLVAGLPMPLKMAGSSLFPES